MNDTEPVQHPLHASIARHHIRSVAVVDDAFDRISLISFQEGEEKEFLDALNESDAVLRSFHKLVSDQDREDPVAKKDITDQVVNVLWEKGRSDSGLSDVLRRTLFRVHEQKVLQVEQLCAFLGNDLKIAKIERYGTTAKLPKRHFDMAFIDYRFGPSRQVDSVKRAVRWASHLYQKSQAFIVLMSAEKQAFVSQEDFRRDSELTKGLFEFLDKKEISDEGKFCNRLNSFCAGLGTRKEIHDFAVAAVAACDEALKELKRSIHGLGLEDYAYLEQISLRADGHPLGDYMLWLYGEYFAHNLAKSDGLQPARKSVNALKYEQFLPLQRPPSVMLATMYSAAITEPVHEGWGPHPRADGVAVKPDVPETASPPGDLPRGTGDSAATADGLEAATDPEPQATTESVSGPVQDVPLYQLGDLLVADEKKPVYLVLNAGCDLQFSPDGDRACDLQQSLLLMPGHFEPLDERGQTGEKRTELFELGDMRFRIVWEHTRVEALPYGEVKSKYEKLGYERKSRLKLPYALELQQHFAAQLTRVGVPTPTPVFRERPIEVVGKDAEGNCRSLGTISDGVIVFHHNRGDQFVLTVDCLHEVLDHIDTFINEIITEIELAKAAADAEAALRTEKEKSADATPAVSSIAAATPAGRQKEVIRDPVKEAVSRAGRRWKYVEELRHLRELLAHKCDFQDALHPLPVKSPISQVETVVTNNNSSAQARLEISCGAPRKGRYRSGAPIQLIFSVKDPKTDDVRTGDAGLLPTEEGSQG